MIPKKIHYCWFGGNPMTTLGEKCISSWKKLLPDYEIIEWNETNYDVKKIPYMKEAYDKKKYAFVSDYARFDILNSEGGIYFDCDVEVLQSIDDILEKGPFMGLEGKGRIASGLGVACEKKNPLIEEILGTYKTDHFINSDGTLNQLTVVKRVTDIFRSHGFDDNNPEIQEIAGFFIYPTEYFNPKSIENFEIKITEKTRTIHHFAASWLSPATQKMFRRKAWISANVKNHFLAICLEKSVVMIKIVSDLFRRNKV